MVQAVAAAGAWGSPDRHARLLEGEEVPLHCPGADLEAICEPAGAARAWRSASQLVDQRVEPVGAVHL